MCSFTCTRKQEKLQCMLLCPFCIIIIISMSLLQVLQTRWIIYFLSIQRLERYVGVTSTQKTFFIGFSFIHRENQTHYTWVLNCLRSTLENCMLSRVIITDRELALINACETVFSDAARLLCR
uniref:MULE transposase domain-containing protein n=1 Tax=Lactuca sativa TaxID=4236 RepID=A0A9R1UHZ4_LACSA|nr:hypothetical protein LSAT_V11C900494400 [Lactuca sativa]